MAIQEIVPIKELDKSLDRQMVALGGRTLRASVTTSVIFASGEVPSYVEQLAHLRPGRYLVLVENSTLPARSAQITAVPHVRAGSDVLLVSEIVALPSAVNEVASLVDAFAVVGAKRDLFFLNSRAEEIAAELRGKNLIRYADALVFCSEESSELAAQLAQDSFASLVDTTWIQAAPWKKFPGDQWAQFAVDSIDVHAAWSRGSLLTLGAVLSKMGVELRAFSVTNGYECWSADASRAINLRWVEAENDSTSFISMSYQGNEVYTAELSPSVPSAKADPLSMLSLWAKGEVPLLRYRPALHIARDFERL